MTSSVQAQPEAVWLYAAGSLREALIEVAKQFELDTGQKVALTFGASGLLRERIENGEPAHVFASADTDHPQRLAQAGGWLPPVVFARNLMCALASPSVEAKPDTLLQTMLRTDVRVGTSTPKADPSGDLPGRCFAAPRPCKPAPTPCLTPRRSSSAAAPIRRRRQLAAAPTRG